MNLPRVFLLPLCALVFGCSTRAPMPVPPSAPAGAPSGRYYADDGPPTVAPEQLENTPDAVPRAEALHRFANRAYVVFGTSYQPRTTLAPFKETGVGSWYGRKFHGQKTAIGEVYDMFAMTAAHPTAPLPSYMRVRNLENGRAAIVRVNDRGPFLHGRVIDLSYAAAAKLGYVRQGSARVEVELIDTAGISPLAPTQVAEPLRIEAMPQELQSQQLQQQSTTGVYLQLAAFSHEPNAQSFLNQLGPRVSDVVGMAPHTLTRDGLLRVRVGPFPSRDAALVVSQRLKQQLGIHGVLSIQP
jgi:rare lipoprotein A